MLHLPLTYLSLCLRAWNKFLDQPENEGPEDEHHVDGEPSQGPITLEVFHHAGHPLSNKMQTGNKWFDRHFEDLRLDDFGNIMHLPAPFWSDISAQFTHGFPHQLIVHYHRDLLPGNVVVAAHISNQAMCSISTGETNTVHNQFPSFQFLFSILQET